MDSQFNSLMNSYNSNYVQYKVTGNKLYETSFNAAKEGMVSILNKLKDEVDSEKSQMKNFYNSRVQQTLDTQKQNNRKLQRGILAEKDEMTAAKMRNEQPAPSPAPVLITTTQYVALSVLGVVMVGMAFV